MRTDWANLFEHKGAIWLLGTATDGPAPIKISRSPDGLSWPESATAVLSNETYNTGPTPSLVSGGRIYRAMEYFRPPHRWGKDYEAMLIHASVDADLLDPASWTVSKSLAFDSKSWIPASWGALTNPGFLEGNAVEGPDGSVLNILRLNSEPVIGNKAVMTRFDPSSNSLRFERIIDLPGGHTKFVIRRHEPSKLYFTLSNNNTDAQYEDQRNVLCLCVSADLITWTIVKTLLEDDTGLSSGDSVRCRI